jgi:benzaldehyde dehydrogenase (NAD)
MTLARMQADATLSNAAAASDDLLAGDVWSGRIFSSGWRAGLRSETISDLWSGRSLGEVGVAGPADVGETCAKARAAQVDWAAAGPEVRARVLRAAAGRLEAHAADVAEWLVLEGGASRAKAAYEVGVTVQAFFDAAAMTYQAHGLSLPSPAGRLSIARRRPLGVVGVISPFNFPLFLAARSVAPALAVGNAVVLKPDLRTAVSGGFTLARILELADLPTDLFHVLPGGADVGEALCADPNVQMIQFTGSSGVGRKVAEAAGRHLKKVSLELGGKNALIVLNDADLDVAASQAAWSAFVHQGQICMSSGRILVQEDVAEAFVERLAAKARVLRESDGTPDGSALGPIIDRRQADRVSQLVSASVALGAAAVVQGAQDDTRLAPTVLADVAPGMPVYEEEVFGPVAAVTRFSTDEEAVRLANDTPYGLTAGVITRSLDRAMRFAEQLHVGMLHINDQTVANDIVNPFGGVGQSGGGLSLGGPANWEAFTHWQWVTLRGEALAYPF